MWTMLIGSDLVPTDLNYDLFEQGGAKALLGEKLQTELAAADFRIFNLETPITDFPAPIPKCGPNLIVPTRTIKGIKAIDPSLLALANNHILDQGDDAMFATMALLAQWEIPYVGAGKNLAEAMQPYIVEAEGRRIGIYNCAEHEFTIAEDNKAGANPFDPLESPDHVAALKEQCDYVIVLYHGGKEHYRYPTPNLQKVCRKLAEKGADLVVCQHSHCVGCVEKYEGCTIVYGQGNFMFVKYDNEFWRTGMLVKVDFDGEARVSYVPVCKNDNVIRMAEGEEAEKILNGLFERSAELGCPEKLEAHLRELSEQTKRMYLYHTAGGESVLGPELDFKPEYSQKALLRMMNYLICEPHRELLTYAVTELYRQSKADGQA